MKHTSEEWAAARDSDWQLTATTLEAACFFTSGSGAFTPHPQEGLRLSRSDPFSSKQQLCPPAQAKPPERKTPCALAHQNKLSHHEASLWLSLEKSNVQGGGSRQGAPLPVHPKTFLSEVHEYSLCSQDVSWQSSVTQVKAKVTGGFANKKNRKEEKIGSSGNKQFNR